MCAKNQSESLASSLVSSLFCGLPRQAHRMAVFVSFSDESSGKNKRDPFVFAGWVATHKDWREIFTPAWEHLVLKGPPPIPFVHMTDMYSPKWREAHRISKSDANHRIDQAVKALAAANDYIVPIELSVSGAEVSDQMGHVRMGVSNQTICVF
jgi:hypothetical protein